MKRNRIISFILCLTFIFSCFSAYSVVIADPSEAPLTDPSVIDNNQSAEEVEFDIYPSITEEITIPDEDIPEVIPVENIISKGHSKRLREEEKDLNTIVFENKHGTTTTYVYAKPVKYIENGKIKDKSSKITMVISDKDAYSMKDNSVKITFAKKASNGVRIEYNDYKITFAPTTDSKASPIFNEELNTVTYEGVFGDKTSVVYKTNLNGVKEDIVLYEDIGVYSFSFEYHTQKLTAYKEADTWYFVNENNEKVASLGSIIIKDSNGNQTLGEISVKELNKNKYTVTVNVPKEFMQSDDTVYPVYVDPAIIMEPQVNDTIIDVGVYSTSTGASYAESHNDYHYLGYNSNTQSTGIVVYKLPGFYDPYGAFASYSANKIINVTMNIPFAGTSEIGNVEMFPMTGTWSSSYGVNPIAIASSQLMTQKDTTHLISGYTSEIAEVYRYMSFDITTIVRSWYTNASEPSYGVAMVLNNNYCRHAFSTENTFGLDVYYVVEAFSPNSNSEYTSNLSGEFYINIDNTPNFLSHNTVTLQSTSYNTTNSKWTLEYVDNFEYIIKSSTNPTKILYKNSNVQNVNIGTLPSEPTSQYKYKWNIILCNGKYHISNSFSNQYLMLPPNDVFQRLVTTEVFSNSTVFNLYSVDECVDLTSFNSYMYYWMDSISGTTLEIELGCSPEDYTFNDEKFYTINGVTFDVFNRQVKYDDVYYDSSYNYLAELEYINSNTFKLTSKGNSGYLILHIKHEPSGVSKQVVIVIGQLIDNGDYKIKNVATDLYADVESTSVAQSPIEQNNYSSSDKQVWTFQYTSHGSYTIKNKQTNKYLSVNYSGGGIIQNATFSEKAEWNAIMSVRGNIIFRSKGTPSVVLSVPSVSSGVGVNLSNQTYTNNTNYNDEWLIETPQMHDVFFLGITNDNVAGIYLNDTLETLENAGYSNNNFYKIGSIGPDFIANEMMNSKIFIILCHGESDRLFTSASPNIKNTQTTGTFTASMLPDNSLANTELVIYLSCKAGQGGLDANNLVTQTAAKDARTVIGFDGTTDSYLIDQWYRKFFELYSQEEHNNYRDICDAVYRDLSEVFSKSNNPDVYRYPVISGELTLP